MTKKRKTLNNPPPPETTYVVSKHPGTGVKSYYPQVNAFNKTTTGRIAFKTATLALAEAQRMYDELAEVEAAKQEFETSFAIEEALLDEEENEDLGTPESPTSPEAE